jgi:hypothetical protein
MVAAQRRGLAASRRLQRLRELGGRRAGAVWPPPLPNGASWRWLVHAPLAGKRPWVRRSTFCPRALAQYPSAPKLFTPLAEPAVWLVLVPPVLAFCIVLLLLPPQAASHCRRHWRAAASLARCTGSPLDGFGGFTGIGRLWLRFLPTIWNGLPGPHRGHFPESLACGRQRAACPLDKTNPSRLLYSSTTSSRNSVLGSPVPVRAVAGGSGDASGDRQSHGQ